MQTQTRLESPRLPWCRGVGTGILLLLIAIILLSHGMGAGLDHDEHQFVASGALLARRRLLPYRDYPYFHTPNLVFVYAAIFHFTRHLLLAARLFSIACGMGTLVIVFAVSYDALRPASASLRWLGALSASLLLLVNPLFVAADGLAWNHDAAELLLVGATALFLREMSRGYRAAPLALCGLLLGLAVGTRLTIAPAAAAFAGMILADTGRKPMARAGALGAFLAGGLISLVPSLWLLWIAPRGFVFGNFQYAALNTAWREGSVHGRDTTPVGKLLEFGAILSKPGNLLLLLIVLVGVLTARGRRARGDSLNHSRLTFLGLLVVFLLVGSFAASPSFAVYFYAPLPVVIWWSAYALAPVIAQEEKRSALGSGINIAVCVVLGALAYRSPGLIARPSRWVPVGVHSTGQRLCAATGPGHVLTLAPIFPLEGGQEVYEAYATGPFVSRVADLIDRADRCRLHLLGSGDLLAELRSQRPSAVVLGFEGELEQPLRRSGASLGCPIVRLKKTRDPGTWLIVPDSAHSTGGDSIQVAP